MRLRFLTTAAALGFAACGNPSGEAGSVEAPSAKSASTTLRLTAPRASHSAVSLPNGDVLFFGGCVADSCELGPASATVDRFDTRRGIISPAGELAGPRVSMVAQLLSDGRILLAGGWAGSAVTGAIETYDPATRRSTAAAPLGVARADIAHAVLPDGRVLLAGGYADGRALPLIELFDPADRKISRVGNLGVPRAGAVAVTLADGRVLIAGGGENGPGGLAPSAAAEIFDPRDGSVEATASLATARYKHAAVRLRDGKVLVVGGSDSRDRGGKISALEAFDPATGRFEGAGLTLDARYKIASAVLLLPDGRVLIAGGAGQPEIYDPLSKRSQRSGPVLGEALNFSSATLLRDGSVLIAGGYSEDGIRVRDAVWRFNPEAR